MLTHKSDFRSGTELPPVSSRADGEFHRPFVGHGIAKHYLAAIGSVSLLLLSSVEFLNMFPFGSETFISGVVALDRPNIRVIAVSGGTLRSVRVHVGDVVHEGETMAELDGEPFQSEQKTLETVIARDNIRIVRLEAEINGDNRFGMASSALSIPVEELRTSLDYERAAFRTDSDRTSTRKVANGIERTGIRRTIDAVVLQMKVLGQRLSLADGYAAQVRRLWARQELPNNKLAQAYDAELELQGSLSELEERKASLVAKLDLLNASEKSVELSEAANREAEVNQVRQEMATSQMEFDRLSARVSQTILRAPCNCLVEKVVETTPGSALPDGFVVAELSQVNRHLIGLIRLKPEEVDLCKALSELEIRVDQGTLSNGLRLSGRIISISNSPQSDEFGRPSYEAKVELLLRETEATRSDLKAGALFSVVLPNREGNTKRSL